jgi:hypothetical protein
MPPKKDSNMPKIRGRRVYAGNLQERRAIKALGCDSLYVPRGQNPYLVARRLARAARGTVDLQFLRDVLSRGRAPKPMPFPSPADTPDPEDGCPAPVFADAVGAP